MPESEARQIQELYDLLQLGPPALVGSNGSERIDLPPAVYRILKEVVTNMKLGRPVTVLPEEEQVTTQVAANILGVSRPHLIKLLEAGEIPFTRTGSHRRVLIKDIKSYEKRRDNERRVILARLAKHALEEGSYEGTPIPDGGEDE